MMDIGKLLEGISPGTEGFMEARIVPGGYANLVNNGMSLGVITGLNADEDPKTRTPDLDSEPHLCVPPLSPPNFAGAPWNLPTIARSALGGNTFSLAPAGAFAGTMDPAADLAMGISETTLDLAGHHLVTSGGMCLGVGTSYIKQLNVGTIGILVPSLAELQSEQGNDPLLLVTRPQKSVDFSIGDNTAQSPALTIHLNHLEVDFYAFIWERYVRAFTLDLTMNVGINLTFEQMANMPAVIKPELVGISADEVEVKVLNSQFVRETPQHLEMVLPSVFDLVTPLLGNLPDIQVPSFAGFSLNNLSIQKVVTSQDEFLALYASLGSSQMMRTLGEHNAFVADAVRMMDSDIPAAQPPSSGRAKLVSVTTPEAATVRSALLGEPGGALPSIKFDVDRYDRGGRELEWSWNINGGLWRPYTSASPLVITDKAFAWQGKYEIGLKSRVKGDYRTVSEPIKTKVVIDSVGPNIFPDSAKWDGDQLQVPVWDVVFGKDVEVAFGYLGDDAPATKWVPARTASLARDSAALLTQDHDGELAVFARDGEGNQTIAIVAPFHGQAGAAGCSCQTSGAPGAGSLILFGLVGLGVFGRRRPRARRLVRRALKSRAVRTAGMFVGMVLVSSLVPGCSCGKSPARACETAEDCGPDYCPEGQLPFCIDNMCVCDDDIPPGRIGPYSDVAVGGGTIWVSAYASSHGDLVVAQATGGRIPDEAWEWVDGVPEGPVAIPGSKIRGGIAEDGPDVGMYTSIAVAPDGTPMVSYFDRDTASLKLAARVGGVWQTSVVETGTSQIDPGTGGSLIGMYTSLTLRSDDGRPGIAYLAHVADATGEHAEVRYASAQTQFPTGPGDWQTWVVDTAPVPENPDEIYPLPGGLGLFVDSARNPVDQAPVVVYYDRTNGDLKIARFDPQLGQFATPVILDGSNGVDAGWSPSVQVDETGVAHVAYVGATGDNLVYTTDAMDAPKEIVDDGYRIVGTTVDGLPKPEFHFVGDDAGLVLPAGGGGPMVVYQDATTQELLLAQRNADGTWGRTSVAGATDPWPGAYGFFASAALSSTDIVMSTWVIDQPTDENWVEVFTKPVVIQ
jgi:MYXO-CTERM domain-containing protein